MRILPVEDDRRTAEFISRGLSQAGYVVQHADDFVRLLERARGRGYETERLDTIADSLDRGSLPLRPLQTGLLPGRAFSCAV